MSLETRSRAESARIAVHLDEIKEARSDGRAAARARSLISQKSAADFRNFSDRPHDPHGGARRQCAITSSD
jgi:hypothetical protein